MALFTTESSKSDGPATKSVNLTFKSLKTILAVRAGKSCVASDVEGIDNSSTQWCYSALKRADTGSLNVIVVSR